MDSLESLAEAFASLTENVKTLNERLDKLEGGGSVKPVSVPKPKKVEKKSFSEIMKSWEDGVGLCPRVIASKDNVNGREHCGNVAVSYRDDKEKTIGYGEYEGEITLDMKCNSRCVDCLTKGFSGTAKHKKLMTNAVKGSPSKDKVITKNIGQMITGVNGPTSPVPEKNIKVDESYVATIMPIENISVVIYRKAKKDGSPSKVGKLKAMGCYYTKDGEFTGKNTSLFCRIPPSFIKKLGSATEDLSTELEELGDGDEEEEPIKKIKSKKEDTDEEEEAPKKKGKSKKEDTDEEEEEAPKKKGKSKKEDTDEEEEEEDKSGPGPPLKPRVNQVDTDEDEEEEGNEDLLARINA
jgi:hypothetical protein